ncbi:MAG TPA: di-heme-cytochrome C peroxidase [Candidatus Angelobacter sp.]|jgi:hypothetical protein
MKKFFYAFLLVAIIAAGAYFFLSKQLAITLPAYQPPPKNLVHLEQNWTADQRLWFHHTAQGTRLVPYKWFMALQQPCLSLTGCDKFADAAYLSRFGFLASTTDPKFNPDGLPIGFARQEDFYDPETKRIDPVLGLTCAACHTGQLNYEGNAVQIEGAPAQIELYQFQKALGVALILTDYIPWRYASFEKQVLGAHATQADKDALKKSFKDFIVRAKWEKDATDKAKIYDNLAGFGRTDALTRIGNQVFAVDMKNANNFAPANAAVRFPQVWDASWFTWVQYNSSISDPLARNIGEAMGVRAEVNLAGPQAADFDNSVQMNGLRTVESLLSGPAPYQGLHSPQWPNIFPTLDQGKITRGAALYQQHCQSCHLPPPAELSKDMASANPVYWHVSKAGKPFLKVKDIKVDYVGTDPHEAMDFMNRTADSGNLKKGRISAAAGLDLVTNGVANKFFTQTNTSPQEQIAWRGYRDPGEPGVRAEAIYKARPLNGIWAASPYLHNGSVPNLYLLLSPQSQRPDTFWTGTKQFDPVKVGHDTSEIKGGYLYDASKPGNSNHGHEFKDGPRGNGVIGPALSPDDRWAIIEYLKSL